jgi:predicted ABC-type ATPase/DNA-directed RNA polymerase specialized sigma24 family protein/8-oxo-dGTP pyrophosphatase MutT (NUDIX family)/curved DNA-binding protein CbpA
MGELNKETSEQSKAMLGAPRLLRSSDPDVYDNPDSARVRARQIGCIGIRRYNNRNGGVSWMPCTNESDYRRVSGFGHSGRRFRRQQLEREVREIIGGRGSRSFSKKSANYTKPELRERLKQRIMAGSKGGAPGQWSARKAQLLASAYRKAGGGYRGRKTSKQRSLSRWTKQKWRTIDGKPARRGNVVRRYLPAKAWAKLTPGQRQATNRKKIQGSKRGEQFVANTEAARKARKRSVVSKKHAEFYEDFEFKAVGKKLGRALPGKLGPGSGSGGRKARRVGASLRGAMARFDPNAVDADADNLVQEGTIYERPAPPRSGAVSSLTNIRAPQIPEPERVFGRAARSSDGRLTSPASQAISSGRSRAEREITRGARATQKPRIVPRTPTARRLAEQAGQTAVPAARRGRVAGRRDYAVPQVGRDVRDSIREQRADIYERFATGEYTVQQLADQFDVVRDEITSSIRAHENFRNSNLRKFKKGSPKLYQGISGFGNSRGSFDEAIKERKFGNWDGLVRHIFTDPKLRRSGKHTDMQNDLFKAFPDGKNPDRDSNIELGYLPSVRGESRPPVKAFGDRRSPTPEFKPLSLSPRQPGRLGSASDIAERAGRRAAFRRDSLIIDAMRRGDSISGAMSSVNMTPAEERDWKRKEWTRQQLKNFALDPDVKKKYPTLAAQLGDGPLIDAVLGLDGLDDGSLGNLWDATVTEISATPGSKVPAYQARQAPLSPRELAAASTVKRPLVSAFLDEYKKSAPGGQLAKLDASRMTDEDVESFYNTFILPELINNGAPSQQDIEAAAALPAVRSRLNEAEQILLNVPLELRTLDLRMKLARKALESTNIDPDSPEFEDALQKLINDQLDLEAVQFTEDVEKWLRGGFDRPRRIPINPMTGQEYTDGELEAQINVVNDNIERLSAGLDERQMEELQRLGMIRNILAEALGLEEFLAEGDARNLDKPVDPLTGRELSMREYLESASYQLSQVPINPLTGKKYTRREMQEQIANLDARSETIRTGMGISKLNQIGGQQQLLGALMRAAAQLEPDDSGMPDDIDIPGDGDVDVMEPEDKPDADVINEMLDAFKDVLGDAGDTTVSIRSEDIIRARQLNRQLESMPDPRSTVPDTDDFWTGLSDEDGNPLPDYDGTANHPLNLGPDGQPLKVDDPDFMLADSLYREHLDPNNYELQEWISVDNPHLGGRYTAPPKELVSRFYQGDADSKDPEQIDKRISWDRLIGYIQKTAPNLFRRNKKGELVGDMNELTRNGNYGGASFSNAQFDPNVPSSGYQFEAQLAELRDATIAAQNAEYLSQDATSATARARLWDLHTQGGFTPDEIAFDLEIVDPQVVSTALMMHASDNNISSSQQRQFMNIAQQAAGPRRATYDKRRVQRIIDDLRGLARLSGSGATDSRSMVTEIDRAIAIQEDRLAKVQREYDNFRAETRTLQNMLTGLLLTRPKNRKMVRDNDGNIVQDGWDETKEPLARYLNRIRLWDDEYIGSTNPVTGERRIGMVTYLVNRMKDMARMTGDDGGASATTFIAQVAQSNIAGLRQFRSEIQGVSSDAQNVGISGFMRSGSAINRAEFAARRGARKAASGRFDFADPRILKRFDNAGYPVTRNMVGAASGFNPQYSNFIADATRVNNFKYANGPEFNYLNPREQQIIRALDDMGVSGPVRNPAPGVRDENIGRRVRDAIGMNKRPIKRSGLDLTGPVEPKRNLFNPETYGRQSMRNRTSINIAGRMSSSKPDMLMEMEVEQAPNGKWYVVNRHGQALVDSPFDSMSKAKDAMYSLRQTIHEKGRRRDLPGTVAEWEATVAGMKQVGYRSLSREMRNAMDVAPISANGEKNRFIFKIDAGPKPRAGDSVIFRRNPSNNQPEVLLIGRAFGPHRTEADGTMSLPGGLFDAEAGDKDLMDTALREAVEEIGLDQSRLLKVERLGIIDAPDWDPRFSKGVEVGGIFVEVPGDWEPTAGDDALSARFVSLSDIASGEVPLGFGHAAWLEAAFGGSEDEDIAKHTTGIALANRLSRERQQRIIASVNEGRKIWNRDTQKQAITLFDQDNPELGLFPDEMPEPTWGWRPTGPEAEARVAEVRKRVLAQAKAELAKRNPPKGGFGRISGSMKARALEVDTPDFAYRMSPDARERIETDVMSLRRKGMSARSIAETLSNVYSIDDSMIVDGLAVSPTDSLVHGVIRSAKDSGVNLPEAKDAFDRRNFDLTSDAAQMAISGMDRSSIASYLDTSDARAARILNSLGFNVMPGDGSPTSIESGRQKFADLPISKQLYIDSAYRRMTLSELSKKYKLPESRIRESIEQYRTIADSDMDMISGKYRSLMRDGGESVLTPEEMNHVRMRLDGMSYSEISSAMGIPEGVSRKREASSLAKLRAIDNDGFYEVEKEKTIQRIRSLPVTEYIDERALSYAAAAGSTPPPDDPDDPNRIPQEEINKLQKKFTAARDMRDFRSSAKDAYMRNQYLGQSVEEIADMQNKSPREVQQAISSYDKAVQESDTLRDRALRRALASAADSLFTENELAFINIRNDGASLDDVARYFGTDKDSVRARQMILMSRLNLNNGLSSSIDSVLDADSRDLYNELGVPTSASREQLEDAMHDVIKTHFDKALRKDRDSREIMRKASEAYAILSNENLRNRYDGNELSPSSAKSFWENYDDFTSYVDPSTGQRRHRSFGYAMNEEPFKSRDAFRLPHDTGSDIISDDIDDGFLGFTLNDNVSDSSISDMMYRKPIPGTKEWRDKRRDAQIAISSGDPRYIFDQDGFIAGKNMSFDPRYDDPMSPDYIGDRFGGPAKGVSPFQDMDFNPKKKINNSISGKMSSKWDDTYEKSIGVNLPPAESIDNADKTNMSSFFKFASPGKNESFFEMTSTFGGKTPVRESRFWGLYFPIAEAINNSVTKRKRKKGERKVFVSVGGAPGSGKTSMRTDGTGGIPSVNDAVHVDADKIKLLIPEARAMHDAGNPNWGDSVHEESRLIADLTLRMGLEQDHDIVYDSTGQFNSGYDTLKAARANGYDIVMHYVSAPQSVLTERVDEREKTDNRRLPRHIIAATIDRNYKIMPEVAEASDEFYLWDSSGKQKVLVAKKEKGKKLEILDARAYLYGGFDDSGQKITMDNPVKVAPQRKVAKGSRDAKFLEDIGSGISLGEAAKKHNMSKQSAFVIASEVEIDPNLPEVKPWQPTTTGKLPTGKKAPKNAAYIPDSQAEEIFLTLPDQVQQDIISMVSGNLDESVKKQLQDYLSQNEIPSDVMVWAWENLDTLTSDPTDEMFEDQEQWSMLPESTKDAIMTALEGGSDPLEIAQILGVPFSWVERGVEEMYEDDGNDISGRMSSPKKAASKISDLSAKKSPRWSDSEISAAGAVDADLPPKPGISGSMSSPDGLNEELAEYYDEEGPLGFPTIRHPLMYWMGPVDADLINKMFSQKVNAVNDAYENGKWNSYIYMHERPYRLDALMDIEDRMSDEEFWENVGSIWVDSENIWQNQDVWSDILTSDRPGREKIMTAEELQDFNNLPDEITVYRGHIKGKNKDGLSWTTSEEKARWFANRLASGKDVPEVAEGTVKKSDVIAHFTRRGESEIVVSSPDKISGRMSDEQPTDEQRKANARIKRAFAVERGEAMAQEMLDAMARMDGFQDWEHYSLSKKNQDELVFAEKYSGGPGRLELDPDITDGFHYRVENPSGYYGIHRGAGMDIHHPRAGAVDFISFTDMYKHSILTPMTPDEWPSPQQVQDELDGWVKTYREDYDRNYGKP